jgi:nucleotide-binding universal stress UspA family protein
MKNKKEKDMKKVQQVMVATDRSAMAKEAVKRAISIAKEKDAQLFIIHVIEPPFIESPYLKEIDQNEIKKALKQEIDTLNPEPKISYTLFLEHGNVADAIIHRANQVQTDLLVVGSHGKNDVQSNYLGSSTLKLIQKTHIPVLLVKNEVRGTYQTMIAPTNMSESSKESIIFANTLFAKSSRKYLFAHETFTELQSLTYHVSKEQLQSLQIEMEMNARDALDEFAKEVGKGEKAFIHFKASVNEDLLDYIVKDKADLLVLGSKGVDNFNSFVFGSTASFLLQNSPTDVLVYVPSS